MSRVPHHPLDPIGAGKVLVTGGLADASTYQFTAEVYDPATGTFAQTGSMFAARIFPIATLLATGRVLVTGSGTRVEVFDVAQGEWYATGPMNALRENYATTRLADGRVLVAGGLRGGATPPPGETHLRREAEVYDPGTQVWTPTGSMNEGRYLLVGTLLQNGKVLITGNSSASPETAPTAELYDPASGAWSFTGSLFHPRFGHTATLLPNGRVLVASGMGPFQSHSPAHNTCTDSAELYDPERGEWFATGRLRTARRYHTATSLADGRVLVLGGWDGLSEHAVQEAEIYDPLSQVWTPTPLAPRPLCFHTATLLADGRVLVAGGSDRPTGFPATARADLFDPATGQWTQTGSMTTPRSAHGAALLGVSFTVPPRGISLLELLGEPAIGPAAATQGPDQRPVRS